MWIEIFQRSHIDASVVRARMVHWFPGRSRHPTENKLTRKRRRRGAECHMHSIPIRCHLEAPRSDLCVVFATMSTTHQFYFMRVHFHRNGIIPDYPMHSRLFTHSTEKLFIIVALNVIKILHVASIVATSGFLHSCVLFADGAFRALWAADGDRYMQHPFAHFFHTIECNGRHMRSNWFYFISIFAYSMPTQYSIQTYLFVFNSMQCDERSWTDWLNVSINWSNKIYNNFVYCVQFSFRALTPIAFYIADYRQSLFAPLCRSVFCILFCVLLWPSDCIRLRRSTMVCRCLANLFCLVFVINVTIAHACYTHTHTLIVIYW